MSCWPKSSMCVVQIAALPATMILMLVGLVSCAPAPESSSLPVPRGYLPTLQLKSGGKNVAFGPFVGYYFRPQEPGNLQRLDFVCVNERNFYTRDVAENALLFTGTAVLTTLPDVGPPLPAANRINPVFFQDAPPEWIHSRPTPADAFTHFHSCYDAAGPVLTGYWLRHVAVTNFTYDMGGRVTSNSPLYHAVAAGVDTRFARILEFDAGPPD